jgi:limonene-1,2-epoxide hydrolase
VRLAPLLAVVLLAAACGGHTSTPQQVVRAWSAALDANDNKAAAALFAPDALVVQSGTITLHTAKDAADWNSGLPCGGIVESITPQGRSEFLAVFTLTNRPGHYCTGPGATDAAVFKVVRGKITLWHQVPPPPSTPTV